MKVLRLVAMISALAAAPAGAAAVTIENAWIRLPAPGQRIAAGYCDIRNDGAAAVTIVGFSGPLRVAIHETRIEDGVARMRPLAGLDVPAKSTAQLTPGGKHLMLYGVDAARLGSGPVTLRARLASGEEIAANFELRAASAGVNSETATGQAAATRQEAKH